MRDLRLWPRIRRAAHPRRVTNASCALIFVGLGSIVALDGSPFGRVIRLLVLGAACISVALLHHAGHTGGLHTWPREWARRVTRFLDRALLTSRSDA